MSTEQWERLEEAQRRMDYLVRDYDRTDLGDLTQGWHEVQRAMGPLLKDGR